MSWLGLDHFVAVKAALGAQAAAARFLDVGGKTSAAQAEDSVEMADADDAAERRSSFTWSTRTLPGTIATDRHRPEGRGQPIGSYPTVLLPPS